MKVYEIQYIKGMAEFDRQKKYLGKVCIDEFPWEDNMHPTVEAVMAYDEENIYVYMEAQEKHIRAVEIEHNGPIYTDSCMEVYLRPCRESSMYFNIEINPIGTAYLSVGDKRSDRLLIDEDAIKEMQIKTAICRNENGMYCWSITYRIPYKLIKKYIGDFDEKESLEMEGNFYKCGNKLPSAHWGCWNLVSWEKPDFHRPEYFGKIVAI